LSSPIFELIIQHRLIHSRNVLTGTENRCHVMILDNPQGIAYAYAWLTSGKLNVSLLSSMDSGLEAFSLNPTHGSFSALTFQSTELANYVNQRFLSY